MGNVTNRILLLLAYVLVITLILISLNHGFFWDTVELASLHANFYQTTHFSQLLPPEDFDSGHIPAFGFYIGIIWELFGRTLQSSHLAMLPFAIGIVYQLDKLCLRFIPQLYSGIALLMILIDPTIMAQITLVSPDVALAFFFLLALNAVLENKKLLILLAVLMLFLTSMRGMMVSFCLLLIDIALNIPIQRNIKWLYSILKRSLLYLPAFLAFAAYNLYHYAAKGWIGYHKDSPWADCFAPVGIKGFFFNIGLLGWRMLDFGRVGIWFVFLVLLLMKRRQLYKDKKAVLLGGIFICLMVFLPMNMLWAKNLVAHRYLIPLYLVFALLCAHLLFSLEIKTKSRILLSLLWIVVLFSGNFWIYPDKTSKGWDSTPAHLPYYALRQQAIAYMDSVKINADDVTTFFPNTATFDAIDLNGDLRKFDNFSGKSRYVFYSNAYNIDDAVYDKLQQYQKIKTFANHGVRVVILENPNWNRN